LRTPEATLQLEHAGDKARIGVARA
jgi:hypothetical protein